jgi:hypothetical protein
MRMIPRRKSRKDDCFILFVIDVHKLLGKIQHLRTPLIQHIRTSKIRRPGTVFCLEQTVQVSSC